MVDLPALHPFSVTCPAQGSPPPFFRLKSSNQLVSLSSGKAYPHTAALSVKLCTISEPVGGSAPKFSEKSSGFVLTEKSARPFSLACPAQGSPTPSYRSVGQIICQACLPVANMIIDQVMQGSPLTSCLAVPSKLITSVSILTKKQTSESPKVEISTGFIFWKCSTGHFILSRSAHGFSIPSFLLSIANEYSRASGGLFAQILSGNERFDVTPTCPPPLLLHLPCSGLPNTSV